MRDHISVIIKLHNTTNQLGLRHIAGEHEHAECSTIRRLPYGCLAGLRIAQRRLGQPTGTGGDPFELCMVPHFDLRVVLGFGCDSRVTGEIAFTHEDGDFAGVFCQEYGFFCRREPATDHDDLTAIEEFAIARGTIRHTATRVLLFAGKTDFAR